MRVQNITVKTLKDDNFAVDFYLMKKGVLVGYSRLPRTSAPAGQILNTINDSPSLPKIPPEGVDIDEMQVIVAFADFSHEALLDAMSIILPVVPKGSTYMKQSYPMGGRKGWAYPVAIGGTIALFTFLGVAVYKGSKKANAMIDQVRH